MLLRTEIFCTNDMRAKMWVVVIFASLQSCAACLEADLLLLARTSQTHAKLLLAVWKRLNFDVPQKIFWEESQSASFSSLPLGPVIVNTLRSLFLQLYSHFSFSAVSSLSLFLSSSTSFCPGNCQNSDGSLISAPLRLSISRCSSFIWFDLKPCEISNSKSTFSEWNYRASSTETCAKSNQTRESEERW